MGLSEFKWQWIEKIVGDYVIHHNEELVPEGAFWHQVERARMALNLRSAEQEELEHLKRLTEAANSFSELYHLIPSGGYLYISSSKFVSLYLALPDSLRSQIVSPGELTELYHRSDWGKCLIYMRDHQPWGIFVDSHNRPLRPEVPLPWARGEEALSTAIRSLDEEIAYRGRIYDGEKFLQYLMVLDDEDRERLFTDPLFLLRIPKPLERVGLAEPDSQGWGKIAFESRTEEGVQIIERPISAYAFNRLLFALTWQENDTTEGELKEKRTDKELWGDRWEEEEIPNGISPRKP